MSVAGKTGTTDNYGDAWFVGYTPDLVVAVWVGYPDKLRPMLTEFGGEPVTGGTLPAMIWKRFVESVEDEDELRLVLPRAALPRLVVELGRRARGHVAARQRVLPGARLVAYFSGHGPSTTADCKPNEVSVPLVIGMSADEAVAQLGAQPLGAEIAYVPAKPGKTPGLVVNQEPRRGGLSANDSVQLWVSKAQYGQLPNFVGSSVEDVNRELRRLKLRAQAATAKGPSGRSSASARGPGVAVKPGLTVRLVVGDGSGS